MDSRDNTSGNMSSISRVEWVRYRNGESEGCGFDPRCPRWPLTPTCSWTLQQQQKKSNKHYRIVLVQNSTGCFDSTEEDDRIWCDVYEILIAIGISESVYLTYLLEVKRWGLELNKQNIFYLLEWQRFIVKVKSTP